MSEQWWAVKSKHTGEFLCLHPNELDAAESAVEAFDEPMKKYSIIPVRVVDDTEPCEWEKKQGMGHKNVAHFMANEDAIVQMKFCPNCGRILGGVK